MESTMLFCFFIMHGSHSLYVQLKGPEHSIKNSEILLNCTSIIPPVGLFAEFLLNGRSYTSIRSSQGMCLTGPLDENCDYQNCSCSVEGFWFAVQYFTVSNISELLFTCVMKFSDVGERSDIQRTRILDIEGPYIISSDMFPLPSGMATSLICKAVAKHVDIKLAWTCPVLYLKALSNEVVNSTIFISTLKMKTSSIDNRINCSCLLTAEDFMTSTTIKLDVNNSPIIKVTGKNACSSSSTVTLTCAVSGDLAMYGFLPWIQSYKGTLIRKINGSIKKYISVITIGRCNYQDTGNYTCIAWNLFKNKTFWANKTTILKVQERPVVVDSEIISDLVTYLSLRFYSISPPTSVQWYHHRKLINSSSEASVASVLIPMYNTTIQTNGYFVIMTVVNQRGGTYSVVLGNDYGKTTHEFGLLIKGATHNLTAVLWILTSVVVFIFTVSMTALFMNRRYIGGRTTENAAVIYHAAPYIENQVRLYDLPDCRNEEDEDNETSEYIDAIYMEANEHPHYEEIR